MAHWTDTLEAEFCEWRLEEPDVQNTVKCMRAHVIRAETSATWGKTSNKL